MSSKVRLEIATRAFVYTDGYKFARIAKVFLKSSLRAWALEIASAYSIEGT
jgi:hypothetical protein